ncbi:MAG: 4Fe-4S dicluster domain-containing protein, partial [FCB group bacterium]|nr:4Fe-4S dicluster domain-containing protein [FCB group bacterium]
AVVFGHAKDGNLHFVTSIDLDSTEGVTNYAGLMDGLVELTTVKYPGSLKAEHGTGRNMAPFIEAEWGTDLYSMMWDLKQSADPLNILNPGVLLNRDPNIHLKNLKPIPPVNEIVDQCVECGFCEPVCPSRALTTTPRQRIVVAREINLSTDTEVRKAMQNDFDYAGIDTCAVDGLCESACPVNIDTGAFIKLKRRERTNFIGRAIAWLSAHYFGSIQGMVTSASRLLQWKASLFGRDTMESFLRELNRITKGRIPSWSAGLVPLGKKEFSCTGTKPQWVYYPSCLSRSFAPEGTHESLMAILMEITELVGVDIRIPDVDGTCCGTPFSSKGYPEASRKILTRTIELLYSESNQGKLPIVVDTSPCTWKFIHGNHELDSAALKKWEQLTFIDLAPFLNTLITQVNHPPLHRSVAIHPTCSTQKMNLVEEVLECARKCADQVILPVETGCCGYAGDRGLLFPELTAAATQREALNIANGPQLQQGISTSRTCEEGLKNATGIAYVSLALLVRDYLKQSESTHLSSG